MSHDEQILFAERKFKQLPSFNADLEVSNLPPPHPLFQQEWKDSLDKAMSTWNSLDFRGEDETPKPPCYAALMREPGFIFTCTLRAWEFSWMMGYHGPCVVDDMIRFWETIDDHVALSPGVRVKVGSNKIIYLCPILPPTVSCRAYNKSHVVFRVEYVMQIGLHRLTTDKIDTLARDWSLNGNKYLNRPTVSHLRGDAGCMHVLHYVIESWKTNLDRKTCSSNGRCPGHRDIDECFFPRPRKPLRNDDTVLYQPEFEYNRIIETPHACPHQGCEALLCWPELYIHYVSSHISNEMLPKYDHPGHYLPCPGCPFGLATLTLMKGSKYTGSYGDVGQRPRATYKAAECQRWVHHIASYLFFEDKEGANCAPWWGPYYLHGEDLDLLEHSETTTDGTVGMVGMSPIDAFLPV